MTSKAESETRHWRITPAACVLMPQSTGSSVRQWFRVWRWPAGLVAGLLLWLMLVAVVGAATRVGSLLPAWPTARGLPEPMRSANAVQSRMLCRDDSLAKAIRKDGIDCRPGLPPRP